MEQELEGNSCEPGIKKFLWDLGDYIERLGNIVVRAKIRRHRSIGPLPIWLSL